MFTSKRKTNFVRKSSGRLRIVNWLKINSCVLIRTMTLNIKMTRDTSKLPHCGGSRDKSKTKSRSVRVALSRLS